MLMAENEKSGNGGQRAWLGTLLSYSGRCRGRMAGSLLASVLSVAAGFVPFYAAYRIMATAMEGRLAFEEALPWLCLAAASYVASKMLFGVSTLLSHVSAYTILETLRRDFIEKLMRAPSCTTRARCSLSSTPRFYWDGSRAFGKAARGGIRPSGELDD